MSDFPEPLIMSSPGVLAARYFPIDLPDALDELATVGGGGSNISGITVTATISDVDVEYNRVTYPAERVVKVEVEAAEGIEDVDGLIVFSVLSVAGEQFWFKKELFVREFVSLDDPERPLD